MISQGARIKITLENGLAIATVTTLEDDPVGKFTIYQELRILGGWRYEQLRDPPSMILLPA